LFRAKPSQLVGKQCPDFQVTFVDGGNKGKAMKLSELRGSKPMIIDFYTSW